MTMSSCSSENDRYFGPYLDDFEPNPFYATMGQPWVYYAQVGGKKENPNGFVKAFRWYTQDHLPQWRRRRTQQEANTPNIEGFATWLDNKYGQFLAEQSQFTQMSGVETITDSIDDCNQRCLPPMKCMCANYVNRPKRVRSPWTKNNRRNQDEGENQEKKTLSMQFILTPKDMSRSHPVSEHFDPSQVPANRTRGKSRSATNICPSGGNCIDTLTNEEARAICKPKQSKDTYCIDDQEIDKAVTVSVTSSKKRGQTAPKLLNVDVSCTCYVGADTKNAETQYEVSFDVSHETITDNVSGHTEPGEISERPKSRTNRVFKKKRPVPPNVKQSNADVSCQYSELIGGTPCSNLKKSHTKCECPAEPSDKGPANFIARSSYNIADCRTCSEYCRTVEEEKILNKICHCLLPRAIKRTETVVLVNTTTRTKMICKCTDVAAAQTSQHSIHFGNDIPVFMNIACNCNRI